MARKMTPAEARGIGLLIDEFGADFAISMKKPNPKSKRERIRAQLDVEQAIEDCDACGLCDPEQRGLIPFWSSEQFAEYNVAVVTPAPSKMEHEKEEMGYGPWHNDLRTQLSTEGIHNDDITWLSAVAGYPGFNTKPSNKEIHTCRAHLTNALNAAGTEYVLLVGPSPAYSFRSDLRYTNLIGHWFIWWDRYMVFVVPPPPSKGPRGKMSQKARVEREEWDHWIALFARGVREGQKAELLSSGCVYTDCSNPMLAWDDNGVPWCEKHLQPTRFVKDKREKKTKKNRLPDVAQKRMDV